MDTNTEFDVHAAAGQLAEVLDAIKSMDDREADLKCQLGVNAHEQELRFGDVHAILQQAQRAGLTSGSWTVLWGGRREEVARALTAYSLRGLVL